MIQVRGITLIVVHPGDLTLKGMQQKVSNLLPARDLAGCELLIDLLEIESRNYRGHVERMYQLSP